MPTSQTYDLLRGLSNKMGAGDQLKISSGTATFSQWGALKRMGIASVTAFLDQSPIQDMADQLGDGQTLTLRHKSAGLVRWGTVQAIGLTAIAVRLNRKEVTRA